MKATRILSLILAIVMLSTSFLFVACAKEEEEGGKGGGVAVNTEAEDESKKYTAEIKNLNGHEFHFLTRGTNPTSHLATHAVYAETTNGEKVNDAVYARNAQLAEKYNCTITEERYSNPGASARESLIAGDYVADFIMGTAYQTRTLASAGLLVDFNTLENIDLTKAWWDQNAMAGMNVGGKTFFITGDAATLDDRGSWIMYVNRDILHIYDPNLDIYDVVRKGEWTLEYMAKIMSETAADMDGDGQITKIGTDRFGYTGERNNNWYHIAAQNITLAKPTPSGDFEIFPTLGSDLLTAWEAARKVLASPYRIVSDTGNYFRNNLSTFWGCNVGTMLNAGNVTINIGFLPLPKQSVEQDKYYTAVEYIQLGSYCIPYSVEQAEDWETNGFTSGAEQCAYFLEAFAYYSMQILTPAFYDQVIMKQSVRDAESAEMVRMALENKMYDPVVGYDMGSTMAIFKGACGSAGEIANDLEYDGISTLYDARYQAARKALNDYIKYINTESL